MSELTFLTEEQCFGDSQIDILKKRGTKAAITDFAILLGGYVSKNYHIDEDSSLDGRTGWYWTKSDDGANGARVVDVYGFSYYYYVNNFLAVVAQLHRSHPSLPSPRTERVGREQKTEYSK